MIYFDSMAKSAALIYNDTINFTNEMTDEEAGRLFKKILSYQNWIDMECDSLTRIVFAKIKPLLDENNQKYDEHCKRQQEKIKKRWNKDDTVVYRGIPNTDTDTDIVSSKEDIIVQIKEKFPENQKLAKIIENMIDKWVVITLDKEWKHSAVWWCKWILQEMKDRKFYSDWWEEYNYKWMREVIKKACDWYEWKWLDYNWPKTNLKSWVRTFLTPKK